MNILDCTYHAISEDNIYNWTFSSKPTSSSIIVDLGNVRSINNINFLLYYSYTYYIDVSIDGKEYIRLFDRTDSVHRWWQNLYFDSRPVRFIKLVGTRTFDLYVAAQREGNKLVENEWIKTKYYSFNVVCLQAMHATINYPELVDGVIKPKRNVAKIENDVIVKACGSGNRIEMLNEDPRSAACHYRDGCILIQLNQPYYIGSLRMLLGLTDYSVEYSFCIETSIDESIWEMAIDKRNESLSGWQEFDFEPRPTTFIRIKGTRDTRDVRFVFSANVQ